MEEIKPYKSKIPNPFLEGTPKKEETMSTDIAKVNEAALTKFRKVKETTDNQAKLCNAIVVSDDQTLTKATQVLSVAQKTLKSVEDQRKAMKAPYLKAGNDIDAAAKELTEPLSKAIADGKQKVLEYNQKVQAGQAEKIAALEAEKEKQAEQLQAGSDKREEQYRLFEGILKQISDKSQLCRTEDNCAKLINSINTKFPSVEQYGEFASEALEVKEYSLYILNEKAKLFKDRPETLTEEQVAAEKELRNNEATGWRNITDKATRRFKEEATEDQAQSDEKHAEIAQKVVEVAAAAPTGMRKTMQFEIAANFSDIPDGFKMLNEKAVREWMKENKAAIKDGDVHHGIRFFEKQTVVV